MALRATSLEGALKFLVGQFLQIFGTDESTKAAADTLMPYLLPLMAELDPEGAGGAMLLGLDGICIISHGSSSAMAMKNAIKVGHDLAVAGITEDLRTAIGG